MKIFTILVDDLPISKFTPNLFIYQINIDGVTKSMVWDVFSKQPATKLMSFEEIHSSIKIFADFFDPRPSEQTASVWYSPYTNCPLLENEAGPNGENLTLDKLIQNIL